VVDSFGNSAVANVYVGVPHDRSSVDDGAAAGYRVLFGDVNKDSVVNIFDLGTVKSQLFKPVTDSNRACDVNGDGIINVFDLGRVKANLFKSVSGP
jgi:hypothetical protein